MNGKFTSQKRDFIRLNIIPKIFIPSTRKTILNINKTLDYNGFHQKKLCYIANTTSNIMKNIWWWLTCFRLNFNIHIRIGTFFSLHGNIILGFMLSLVVQKTTTIFVSYNVFRLIVENKKEHPQNKLTQEICVYVRA